MESSQSIFLGLVTSPLELSIDKNILNGDQDAMAILLLVLLLKILAIGGIFLVMAFQVIRKKRKSDHIKSQEKDLYDSWHENMPSGQPQNSQDIEKDLALKPPKTWIAIHSSQLINVEKTFGIKDCERIDWDPIDCLDQSEKIFIAPPTNGWTMVFGEPLKTHYCDIDDLFHFIRQISISYGTVQFFSVDPITGSHCWINSHNGKFLRAYAWDGNTLWNHGKVTEAERKLKMMILDYCSPMPENEDGSFGHVNPNIYKNIDQIYALAGYWGVNPLSVDTSKWGFQKGILGSI